MKYHSYPVATAMALTSLVALATGCGSPTNLNIPNPLANGVTMGGAGCIPAQAALNAQGYSLNFSGTNNAYNSYVILAGQISSLDSQQSGSTFLSGPFFGAPAGGGQYAGQSFGSLNITGGGNAGSAAAGNLSGSSADGQLMINIQNFDNTAGNFGTTGQKVNLTGSVIFSSSKLSIIAAAMGWSAGSAVFSSSGQQTSVAQELCFSGAALSLNVNITQTGGNNLSGRMYLYPTNLGSVIASGSNPTSQAIVFQF